MHILKKVIRIKLKFKRVTLYRKSRGGEFINNEMKNESDQTATKHKNEDF